MIFKEPEYIFYPLTPLKCFSNKNAFIKLAKRKKDIDELKKTRTISKKKE